MPLRRHLTTNTFSCRHLSITRPLLHKQEPFHHGALSRSSWDRSHHRHWSRLRSLLFVCDAHFYYATYRVAIIIIKSNISRTDSSDTIKQISVAFSRSSPSALNSHKSIPSATPEVDMSQEYKVRSHNSERGSAVALTACNRYHRSGVELGLYSQRHLHNLAWKLPWTP